MRESRKRLRDCTNLCLVLVPDGLRKTISCPRIGRRRNGNSRYSAASFIASKTSQLMMTRSACREWRKNSHADGGNMIAWPVISCDVLHCSGNRWKLVKINIHGNCIESKPSRVTKLFCHTSEGEVHDSADPVVANQTGQA